MSLHSHYRPTADKRRLRTTRHKRFVPHGTPTNFCEAKISFILGCFPHIVLENLQVVSEDIKSLKKSNKIERSLHKTEKAKIKSNCDQILWRIYRLAHGGFSSYILFHHFSQSFMLTLSNLLISKYAISNHGQNDRRDKREEGE